MKMYRKLHPRSVLGNQYLLWHIWSQEIQVSSIVKPSEIDIYLKDPT